jgi:hypothetical protein
MGRKLVDAAMMEEVIADRDMESVLRPRVVRPVEPSPQVSRPALNSPVGQIATMAYYPEQSKRSFAKWALGAASAAACVAVGTGLFLLSPSRIDRTIQNSFDAWSSVRNIVGSVRNFVALKSGLMPLNPSMNVQAAELPSPESGQFSSSANDDGGIMSIMVQPGDTLRQIILRTDVKPDRDTIKQIRRLNPAIADLDYLKPGQAIRFPRISVPIEPAIVNEATSTAGQN